MEKFRYFRIFLLALTFGNMILIMSSPNLYAEPKLVNIIRLWNYSWVDHFYTTSRNEALHAIDSLEFEHQGLLGKCYTEQVSGTVPLYRLYHTINKRPDHFYTIDPVERDSAINTGNYSLEGISCWVPIKPPAVSVFPGAPPTTGPMVEARPDRNLSTSPEIGPSLRQPNISEVIENLGSGSTPKPKPIPVYRSFSPAPDHFYTTDLDEISKQA